MAKKRAKKTVRKKRKAQKAAGKEGSVVVTVRKKILGRAPEEKTFVLKDGRKLKTVYELIDELETMSDDMFHEYVSDVDNHFANWVEHVFDEKHLANEMRAVKDRLENQRAIMKRLVRELSRLSKK